MIESTFERGIDRAIELIEVQSARPALVAVYGLPNAGKTELIHILAKHLRTQRLEVVDSEGCSPPRTQEELERQEYDCDVFFYHFGFEELLTGRIVHLNFGIFNPSMHERTSNSYDLLIANPDSVDKYNIHRA